MRLSVYGLALIFLSFAFCGALAGTAPLQAGKFDLWQETSQSDWDAYVSTLPEVKLDPTTNDYPVFNATDACKWTIYKQCDSRWGSNRIGTSSKTICQVGCAISSVAQWLKSKGKNYNPASLNNFLIKNGGYANGNLLVWGAVAKIGGVTFRGSQKPTVAELTRGLNACHGIITNVNGGGHWVQLTGYAGSNNFYVNDPGYNRKTYPFREMLRHSVYH